MRDMGKASGVNSTLQRFGSAFVVAIATAVFSANGHLGSASSFAAGFRPSLLVIASLSLVGGLVAFGVRRRESAVVAAEPVAQAA